MHTAKISSVIALALVLFATSAAFAAPYPDDLPKDFKNAPGIFCPREKPTNVFLEIHRVAEKERIRVVSIFGKDGKKTLITFLDVRIKGEIFDMHFTLWLWHQDDWRGLSKEVEHELETNPPFTAEENAFFDNCLKKMDSIPKN